MNQLEDFVAEKLLKVKAIKLQPNNPFEWATGWSSPVYCDNRKILSYPAIRNIIKLEMARLVVETYPDVEVIAGVATNAIAIGVLVAEELGLPFVYVHPTPKDHGFENRIEGDLRPRQKVVIIEDQVSTGANTAKVVDAIRKDACKVLGMLSIFNYQLPAAEKIFNHIGLETSSLCNFDSVLRHAQETEYITAEDANVILAWRKNPAKWKR